MAAPKGDFMKADNIVQRGNHKLGVAIFTTISLC